MVGPIAGQNHIDYNLTRSSLLWPEVAAVGKPKNS
jgi:hypothetical protein